MVTNDSGATTGGATTRVDRIEAARGVVYSDDGEFILPHQLGAALEAYGVDVSETRDGIPAYQNVPPEISLAACHLAVESREDPAVFIVGKNAARYS